MSTETQPVAMTGAHFHAIGSKEKCKTNINNATIKEIETISLHRKTIKFDEFLKTKETKRSMNGPADAIRLATNYKSP